MPPVPMPADFQEQLNRTGNNTFEVTSGGASKPTIGPNGRDRADVYVGVLFDGYRAYDNFTSALPGIQFQFFLPPTIESGNVLSYNPHRRTEIEISVSRCIDLLTVMTDELLSPDRDRLYDNLFCVTSMYCLYARNKTMAYSCQTKMYINSFSTSHAAVLLSSANPLFFLAFR